MIKKCYSLLAALYSDIDISCFTHPVITCDVADEKLPMEADHLPQLATSLYLPELHNRSATPAAAHPHL